MKIFQLILKSKSIKEAREEIDIILNKLENKTTNLADSMDDYKRLIHLNNHIDFLFKKESERDFIYF